MWSNIHWSGSFRSWKRPIQPVTGSTRLGDLDGLTGRGSVVPCRHGGHDVGGPRPRLPGEVARIRGITAPNPELLDPLEGVATGP